MAAPVLETALRKQRAGGRKLLIPYLMGGMTDDWGQALAAVVAAGADAVEVGIPFSDPMMDGPVIQEAALLALQRGTVPGRVLDDIARADISVPVAVMTYYNIVFRAGHRRMAHSMVASGVSAAKNASLSPSLMAAIRVRTAGSLTSCSAIASPLSLLASVTASMVHPGRAAYGSQMGWRS